MRVQLLQIAGVRNLESVTLRPSAAINVLTGPNGSGKTSVLEAVGMLATARSFRAASLDAVINYSSDRFSVFAELVDDGHPDGSIVRVGVGRSRHARLAVRIQGETVRSAAVLAETLPVQIIAPDLSELVAGEPGQRRRFLDWGVFHTHAAYASAWRDLRRALQQRNAALRARVGSLSSARAFDLQVVRAAESVEYLRSAYMARLAPVFLEVAAELALPAQPTMHYRRGWDAKRDLADVLAASIDGDVRAGHTRHGPHRADIRLTVEGRKAGDALSRGQLKCVAFAMLAAQARLLGVDGGKRPVVLVDDLVSELDGLHRARAVGVLVGMGSQVFIADVAGETLRPALVGEHETRWFHVEHGRCEQEFG